MQNAFAIMHTWPDLRNAEYEVIQRVSGAAALVGANVTIINNNGVVLWSSPEIPMKIGEIIDPELIDFILSFHFESPKVIDKYSYYALWQPLQFYFDFGYQKSIDKFSTHNDLISCASDLADAHALNLLEGLGRAPLAPLPEMFHTLPEPFLAPDIGSDSKLFYIGINWERLGRPKGRFHDTLTMLDTKGLTEIYGPEKVHGIAPWEGFKTYQGELPFDGQSVKNAINRCGICLVLSSGPHKATGIMSNRLFEGLAGGAAIIATPNPIIDKYFRDAVYLVDDTRGEAVLAQQILEAMREIRSNPAEAARRTTEGQRILRESCSLERSIQALFYNHPQRVAHFEEAFLATSDVSVVLYFTTGTIDELLGQIKLFQSQTKSTIDLYIVCDETFARLYRTQIAPLATGSLRTIKLHEGRFHPAPATFDGVCPTPSRTGPIVEKILASIATPYFALMNRNETVFSDHFAAIGKALDDQPAAMMGCSGMVLQSTDYTGARIRALDSARFTDLNALVLGNGSDQRGRFLFRSKLLREDRRALFALLDGEEHRYFKLAGILAGPLAQTNYASYVLDESTAGTDRLAAEPAEAQQQYIRDRFTRNAIWLEKLAKGVGIPEFVFAYGPGAPIRWDRYTAPHSMLTRIRPDRMMNTAEGAEGVKYLSSGFGTPAPDHTWLLAGCGIIEFSLPRDIAAESEDYYVSLIVVGRKSVDTGRDQHCTIALNGMVISYCVIPDYFTEIKIDIPANLISGSSTFRLELTPDHADPVFDDGGIIIDSRRLSIMFRSIGVFRRPRQSLPVFDVGEIYGCGSADRGTDALVEGFYASEAEHSWIAGDAATIRFRLRTTATAPALHLTVMGRASLATGAPQIMTLTINGRDLGKHELVEGCQQIDIDLDPGDLSGRSVYLGVKAGHSEAVYDSDHNIIDTRMLGIALLEIGILDRAAEPSDISQNNGVDPSSASDDGIDDVMNDAEEEVIEVRAGFISAWKGLK